MKRFHVHVGVASIDEAIRFYSPLFGKEPDVIKDDYAKWMLDDPRINFAISTRSGKKGVDHLGFQVDSDNELQGVKKILDAAGTEVVEQVGTACCYAESDKYWVQDPAGIPWESFHTLGSVPVFGAPDEKSEKSTQTQSACCAPSVKRSCC